MEGAEEGALGAGLVAAEGGEGLGAAAEEVGQCLIGVEAGVTGFEVLPVVVVAEREDSGFEFAAAGEAPLGHDDLVDECGFEGSDGQEVVEEGTEEVVESLSVFPKMTASSVRPWAARCLRVAIQGAPWKELRACGSALTRVACDSAAVNGTC